MKSNALLPSNPVNESYRYLLIVNPAGGNGKTMKALPRIEHILRQHSVKYEFHFTQEPLHATDLVKELAGSFDVVVAVGGDGTINEIINGLPELDHPVGMIPIGTGNDFARSCCIPHDSIEDAIRILLTHDIKMVDVGEVNGRRFINMLGLGFEGRSAEVGRKLEFLRGPVKYLIGIAFTLFTYKRIPMKITFGLNVFEGDTYQLSVGNGWNAGGGFKLTPKAKLDDGLFDLCYIENVSRWRIITNFHRLSNGTITELEEVNNYQTKELTVESSQLIPLHLDGEELHGDRHQLEIKMHPKAQAVVGNWAGDSRFDD